MKKLLVVVDMQNDFIDGTLGTKEAVAIIPNVAAKVKNWEGDILFTQDTHGDNYLETNEGKNLPVPHCIRNSDGWQLTREIAVPITTKFKTLEKGTFGSEFLATDIKRSKYDYVELIGLCTDICVVSNAILIKTLNPEIEVAVDASCCAGVTPEKHNAALMTMESCQIKILNRE